MWLRNASANDAVGKQMISDRETPQISSDPSINPFRKATRLSVAGIEICDIGIGEEPVDKLRQRAALNPIGGEYIADRIIAAHRQKADRQLRSNLIYNSRAPC